MRFFNWYRYWRFCKITCFLLSGFGFKPTYGRISRWGVIPYAQTLDTVGILGNNMDIIHEVYNVINRYDEKDPTSLPEEVRNKIDATINTEKLVIGIPEEFILDELSDAVRNSWKEILVRLQEQGHEIKPISIGSIKNHYRHTTP